MVRKLAGWYWQIKTRNRMTISECPKITLTSYVMNFVLLYRERLWSESTCINSQDTTCSHFVLFVLLWSHEKNSKCIWWEGTGGREPGRIRAGGEREAGEDGVGCGCRTRAGCGRRMQDAKGFFSDFFALFKLTIKNVHFFFSGTRAGVGRQQGKKIW